MDLLPHKRDQNKSKENIQKTIIIHNNNQDVNK